MKPKSPIAWRDRAFKARTREYWKSYRPLVMSVREMEEEFLAAFEAEKVKQALVLTPAELTIWIEKNRPRFASSAESPETPDAAPGGM